MQQTPPPPDPDTTRRRFLGMMAGMLSALVAVFLGWPLVGSLVGPAYRRRQSRMVRVASLDDLPQNQPVLLSFPFLSDDGFLREEGTRDIWVIKHSPAEVTVFSPICPHLSCRYDWNSQAQQFVCPCHGSVFSATGTVLAGPAPRPLDTLPSTIENGQVMVAWELFQPGIAAKQRV